MVQVHLGPPFFEEEWRSRSSGEAGGTVGSDGQNNFVL